MQRDVNISVETMASLHPIEDKLVQERLQHWQRTPLLIRKRGKKRTNQAYESTHKNSSLHFNNSVIIAKSICFLVQACFLDICVSMFYIWLISQSETCNWTVMQKLIFMSKPCWLKMKKVKARMHKERTEMKCQIKAQ